jgi:hypothetical protein
MCFKIFDAQPSLQYLLTDCIPGNFTFGSRGSFLPRSEISPPPFIYLIIEPFWSFHTCQQVGWKCC